MLVGSVMGPATVMVAESMTDRWVTAGRGAFGRPQLEDDGCREAEYDDEPKRFAESHGSGEPTDNRHHRTAAHRDPVAVWSPGGEEPKQCEVDVTLEADTDRLLGDQHLHGGSRAGTTRDAGTSRQVVAGSVEG